MNHPKKEYRSPIQVDNLENLTIDPKQFEYTVESYASERVKQELHSVLENNIPSRDIDAYIMSYSDIGEGVSLGEKYLQVLASGEYQNFLEEQSRAQEEENQYTAASEIFEYDLLEPEQMLDERIVDTFFHEMLGKELQYHESPISIRDVEQFIYILEEKLYLTPDAIQDIEDILLNNPAKSQKFGVKINNKHMYLTFGEVHLIHIPYIPRVQKQLTRHIFNQLFTPKYIANEMFSYPIAEDAISELKNEGSNDPQGYGPRIFTTDEDF